MSVQQTLTTPATYHNAMSSDAANGVVAVFIGVFLIAVLLTGNFDKLLSALHDDLVGSSGKPGFAKWGIALFILYIISRVQAFRPAAPLFMFGAIAALLVSHTEFLTNIGNTWKSLFSSSGASAGSAIGSLIGQ